MQPFSVKQRHGLRRGISVIEVLFAMGVAVIGLLGIASLIPMAGKNAADSIQMSEAQALAQDWYSELTARGMHVSGNWIMRRDFPTAGYLNFDKQLGTTIPGRGCNPVSSSGMLRELGRESVCLDPYFFAHASVQFPSTSAWATAATMSQSNNYRPAVFPYYQDTYNPLVDPAYPATVSNGFAWDAQPRMVRVTVPGSAGPLVPISIRGLEQAFLSTDDLAITLDVPALNIDDKDATIPPMRVGQSNQRFASTNHYSWFATMSPAEPIPALSTDSTIFYTVSLAVCHNRELNMVDPAITAPRLGAADPPRVEEKPQGERLMWVEPVSGNFIGGNGGRVRLVWNDGMDADLRSGDWVMLSRNYASVAVSVSPFAHRPFSVFRWYRIVSVEQEQSQTLLGSPPLPWQLGTLANVTSSGATTDPAGHASNTLPNQIRAKEVVLEGPDWTFSPTTIVSGSAVTFMTPTSATLVKGVRTVIERVITVN